jgi:hypothetical protein
MKMAASLVGQIAITLPNPDVSPFFMINGIHVRIASDHIVHSSHRLLVGPFRMV